MYLLIFSHWTRSIGNEYNVDSRGDSEYMMSLDQGNASLFILSLVPLIIGRSNRHPPQGATTLVKVDD